VNRLEEFYDLEDAEEYLDFFDIPYDASLVNVKRFHMLKEYSNLVKLASQTFTLEEQLLDFFKFSLLKVYGEFKNGYAPSAADVWNMYDGNKLMGCGTCTPTPENSCGC